MNKRNKFGLISVFVAALILLVILNIVTWVIPFNIVSLAVLITTYVCTTVMIIIAASFIAIEFFSDKYFKHVVLGIPLFGAILIAVGLQILACIGFYLANAYVLVAEWIIIIVEILIYGYLIISVSIGYFFKHRAIQSEHSVFKTKTIEGIRDNILYIKNLNKNSNITADLNDLYELIRFSDKISNIHTAEIENTIIEEVNKLESLIASSSEEEIRTQINHLVDLINKRNVICKNHK